MTNNEAELRERVNKLLDFFTEPGQGEKYLKDLENDLMSLISDHTRKAIEDQYNKSVEVLKDIVAENFHYRLMCGEIKDPSGKIDVHKAFIDYQELEPERQKFADYLESRLALKQPTVEATPKKDEEEEVTPAPTATPEPAAPVAASAVTGNEGSVVMAAAEVKGMQDRITSLEASVKASEEKEVRQEVTEHVARGAIKADQVDQWVGLIMADKSKKDLLARWCALQVAKSKQDQ